MDSNTPSAPSEPQAAAAGAGAGAAPVDAPASSPSLGQQMATATATTDVADAGGVVPAASPAAPPTDGWQGVREYAKAQGVDLSPYEDDGAALSALLQAHRSLQERNYYADLGRRFAPHAEQLREFVQQRQAQRVQPPAPNAWDPPEFNEAWLQQVERDPETGLVRSKAGYDPQLAEKVQAHLDWQRKFIANPGATVGPMIEARARDLIEARFAEHQQRSQADQLVQSHSPWMFQALPDGRRQMTPEGLLYAQAARALWDSGLRDVRTLDAAATAAVENMVLRRKLAVANPQAQAQAQAQSPTLNPVGGAAARPAAGLAAAPTSSQGLSLRELLNSRLNGVEADLVS